VVAANGGQDVLDRLAAGGRRGDVRQVDVAAATRAAVGLANEREVLSESGLAAVAATAVARTGGVTGDVAAVIEATRVGLRTACAAVDLPTGQTAWMPLGVLQAAEAVHEHLVAMSAAAPAQQQVLAHLELTSLTPGQGLAAEAVAAGLPCVIEGPAGTGKTTALRAALAARSAAGLATFAIAKSAAAVAQLGQGWTGSGTADRMLVAAGWSRDGAGAWVAPTPAELVARGLGAGAGLRGSVLVVDEAAMMDVHTLAAVCAHATGQGQRVILVGDDRQLSAVGAGGGFTVAAMGLDTITLAEAKRFTDPGHAELAAAWRSGTDIDQVVDQVMAAGIVVRHDSEDDLRVALAELATDPGAVVIAADNETASAIARLARAERVSGGHVQAPTRRLGRLEEQIGVGDVIQTRANDRDLGVRNRDRWQVQELLEAGGLEVSPIDRNGAVRRDRRVSLPGDYVAANVHHADAVTVYAAQGATARAGHAWVDESWSREQAYVALTRGRDVNQFHVVADDAERVRDLLRGVLTFSQREDAELVARVTRERLIAGRTQIAPGVVARLEEPGESAESRVGVWSSGAGLNVEPPSVPPAKSGPVL